MRLGVSDNFSSRVSRVSNSLDAVCLVDQPDRSDF